MQIASCEVPSPALSRGIAVLVALNTRGELSLEELARSLDLPKASVFRLLSTLVSLGLVRKNAGKAYESLWGLQPLNPPALQCREWALSSLVELSERCGETCEWYEPGAEGMMLVAQHQPERELRVQARPGFIRRWGGELEAVARLGYAFAKCAPAPVSAEAYGKDGVLSKLSLSAVRGRIVAAARDGAALDHAFNSNGVRRAAVAVRTNGEFAGVLAVAQVFRFPKPEALETLLEVFNDKINGI